jgi:hypothetical protein
MRTEIRCRKTITEDRKQKTEVGMQKAEDGSRNPEGRKPGTEIGMWNGIRDDWDTRYGFFLSVLSSFPNAFC